MYFFVCRKGGLYGVIDNVVQWATDIANDDSHGTVNR